MRAFEQRVDCYGFQYFVEVIASWSSDNTSVATVSGGQVTPRGAGQSTIKAMWHSFNSMPTQCSPGSGFEPGPIGEPATCCRVNSLQLRATASVTVQGVDVLIGSLIGIGKGQSVPVEVTLTPSPTRTPVTLTLSTTSGAGSAQFASNNSTTLNITQSTTVEIKGITESSTFDNIRLEARISGQSADTELFSVVLVTPSLRNTGTVSMDNIGRNRYIEILRTDTLGTFTVGGLWFTGVEIIGTVKPSNYQGLITIKRERIEFTFYQNMTLADSGGAMDDTTSDSNLRDDDPLSGGSMGKVYDLDAPAIVNPFGPILRRRVNFRQWAVIPGTEHRLSADLPWFARVSIRNTSSGYVLHTDIPGDNVAGTGATPLTWNLQ